MDSIDLSQVELLTPFFDSDLVTLVSSLPIAWCLDHRLYNRWITRFRCGAGDIYWQSYPGHLPSPHAKPAAANDQWGTDWYSDASVRRSYLGLARGLCARDDRLPFEYVSKAVLRAVMLLNRVGVARYNYEIAYARNILNNLGDVC